MGEHKFFLSETNWVDGGEIKEETNWVRKESYEKKIIEDKEVEPRVSYGRKFLFLLKNNYKTQSILLVRQCFKHIWFLTIRVFCTRFCPVNLHLEIVSHTRFSLSKIESSGLDLLEMKFVLNLA